MLISFEKLDAQSKIWIYQSGKRLNEVEKEFIVKKTESFLVDWTAHGQSIEAGVQIVYDQFIIIGVNEVNSEVGGCSIDKSIHHIRNLEKALNIDLLQRSKVAIKENTQIRLIEFSEIKNMVSKGVISANTEVFNNTILSKIELESDWVQPATNTWLKRYF